MKSYELFKDPSGTGTFYPGSGVGDNIAGGNGASGAAQSNYGGQNSYGHNDFLSTATSATMAT